MLWRHWQNQGACVSVSDVYDVYVSVCDLICAISHPPPFFPVNLDMISWGWIGQLTLLRL